ncbi:hypothetical protein [Pseudoalteromonas piscicida]|uniref:Uncharacterized protein n=1 Tax=Pseudoalteromonas piscicida TaxID=43662 RepID=A0A2A5JSF3_PSEO7|nr:hypothetical protein [Pseudoalteromonas piscicida]PCK32348.1 hypothetical protein CEX98_07760 [Pseudoalteromonas piscicida]
MHYLSLFFGYILFIPFIFFYSYILGPVLKFVLIPGGLAILCLIMGPKDFFFYFNKAKAQTMKPVAISK